MSISEVAKKIRPSSTLSLSTNVRNLIKDGVDIVDFSAGEPDFDTPENIKQAAIEAINENFTRYTHYEGIYELREAIANDLKEKCSLEYSPEQIVVSNGSKHAIKNALTAITDPGDEIILPAPYWNSYLDMIYMVHGVPKIVNTRVQDSFKVTSRLLAEAITEKTKAIILNTPNNPTGMVYSREELEEIAAFVLKNNLYVISDEIYKKLIYSRKLKHTSIASLSDEIKDRTIVIDGFSKSYSMTGWRVGYSASNSEIAKAIGNIQSNSTSNVNSIAQMAALEALTGDKSFEEGMLHEFERRRDYIAQRISDIPMLSSLLPKGAFYLFVDVSRLIGKEIFDIKIQNSDDVAKILLDKYKVAVLPSHVFGIENYIRISFATSMSNIVEGVNRIEKFIKDNF